MSKKPTFRQMIEAFGAARYDEAATGDGPTYPGAVQRTEDARVALVTALRKAGIPLDSTL